MNNIMKYLLAFMLAPAIVFGMEPDREKVCRDEPLSKYLEDCLSQAQTSHALEINNLTGCVVSESLYSVEQCMRLADRMRALPLYAVKLTSLLDDKTMPIEGLKAIMDVLGTLPTLQRLWLPGTRFANLGQERLCLIEGMIQRAPRLSALDLTNCYLAELSADDLSSFLRTLTQKRIDRLGLDGNCLGFRCNKPDCRRIIDALRLMTHSLQSLSLQDNDLYNFSAADWHALGPVIGGLKELDLGGNNLGMPFNGPMSDDSWCALLDKIARSKIEKLNMRINFLSQVSNAVWELFTHTIARMKNLKVLDLRWNWFDVLSHERFELLSSSLLCHDGMTVIIKNSDDPHHWWARLHGEHGLNVAIK